MPTPFYHLKVAQDVLERPGLDPAVREVLERDRPAFLLGNTAPDVQTVSEQSRQETHFFELPVLSGDLPPWERMLQTYPWLAHLRHLSVSQRAFLAGYLCHLQADWYWVMDIFSPVFGPESAWATFDQRLYLHNVLRSYLDFQILDGLPLEMGSWLGAAEPAHWLPFAADLNLRRWRDMLASQLQPGAAVRTVEVFAARQGIAPEAYYHLIRSEDLLEEAVFSRLSRQRLLDYRSHLLAANRQLIQAYFEEG